jgi:thiol-disulfide isomerase/thioredoxin
MHRIWSTFVFLSSSLSGACISGLFPDTSAVSELNVQSFQDSVDSSPDASKSDFVVLFYSTLCSHCRRFAPFFESTANALRANNHTVFVAVDWSDPSNYDLFRAKNIRYFPVVFTVATRKPDHDGDWFSEWQTLDSHPFESFQSNLLTRWPHLKPFVSNGTLPVDLGVESRFSESPSPLAINMDASRALSVILRTEVFRGDAIVLDEVHLNGLRLLLELCSSILALAKVKSDCQTLNLAISQNVNVSRDYWTGLLNLTRSFNPSQPITGFQTCATFSCALWRLLHLLSLGPVNGKHAAIRPVDAMLGIRTVADLFFSCADCRSHFLDGYDACWFGRCSVNDVEQISWEHTGLWLWRFHNAVTSRVNSTNITWPSIHLCGNCYDIAAGVVDETKVLAFLRKTFWVDDLSVVSADSDAQGRGGARKAVETVTILVILLACILTYY